jgi:dihydropteroate synthase
LELGQRTLVMGVLNITPDSFSDGGKYFDRKRAIEHGLRLLDEGADILDIGGESTRPGAHVQSQESGARGQDRGTVSAEEELRRVLPVIQTVKERRPEALVSIDTYKSPVAQEAVRAGAEIVNDVSAFRWDVRMAPTLASLTCGVVLMHMRGRPEEWRTLKPLNDPVALVSEELRTWADAAIRVGISQQRIVLDPGFGFGKNFDENYPLLARFDELHQLGFPLLSGPSRKSFIGRTAGGGRDLEASDRLYGTLAAVTSSVLKGAHIVRVHDVKAAVEAVRVADAVLAAHE